MEGIQTINALKAVMSSLPAQTTIPSGELVMLYATDGTPIAKISRDDLVKAVASVMASNSQNTFSKLLGVQANGTPMGIGASDLASVLGGYYGVKHREINIPGNAGAYVDFSFTDYVDMASGLAIVMVNGTGASSILDLSAGSDVYDGGAASFVSTSQDKPLKFSKPNQSTLRITKNYDWATPCYICQINPRYIL